MVANLPWSMRVGEAALVAPFNEGKPWFDVTVLGPTSRCVALVVTLTAP